MSEYKSNAIAADILSVLDVTASGKVVSAETWTELWKLVFARINSIDAYCVSLEDVIQRLEASSEAFQEAVEQINTKYDALTQGLVHYGDTAPEHPDIKLWVQPVDDVDPDTVVRKRDLAAYYTATTIDAFLNNKANVSDVPTKLSELTNDSGFITKAVNDLVNYYLKSDTYTKTEVNDLIGQIDLSGYATKVSGATNGHFAGLDSNGNLTDSGKGPSDIPLVDQTYSSSSTHAQSGTAVASAISTKPGKFVRTIVNNETRTAEVFNDYTTNGATGNYAHAEGTGTVANGTASHAEGSACTAAGAASHAEGQSCTASGTYAHAEGYQTTASGNFSHATGYLTKATVAGQTAIGECNAEDSNAVFLVGNGASDNTRSNAFKVYKNGQAEVGTAPSSNMHVANKKYVDDSVANKVDKASGVTSGNFAGLDASGNITDSGKSPSDIPTVTQTYLEGSPVAASCAAVGTAISNASRQASGAELDAKSNIIRGVPYQCTSYYTASNATITGYTTFFAGWFYVLIDADTEYYSVVQPYPVDQLYGAQSDKPQSGVAVASAIATKQDTLVSGSNIKTVNNQSILGSGNINISGGGSDTYELVEKIIIGYSLVMYQPLDWSTNYTNYFTNTGTARNPTYTNVPQGTGAPTWETNKYYIYDSNGFTGNLLKNKEPDGTNYDFKKILVYNVESMNNAGNLAFLVNGSFYNQVGGGVLPINRAYDFTFVAENDGGITITQASKNVSSTDDSGQYSYFARMGHPLTATTISSFQLFNYSSANPIPSGTTIYIYAVRK